MHADADSNDPPILAQARRDRRRLPVLLDDAFIRYRQAGLLCSTLARSAAPGTLVELARRSASPIYLALRCATAAKDSPSRPEIHKGKAERARDIEEAGLLDVVDLRVGDAPDLQYLSRRRLHFSRPEGSTCRCL
jgi:hypothetical protein